jgi:hypothetical protein
MIKYINLIILLLIVATSCNKTNNKEKIPVISFKDCSESVDLKLSDIAKDFRFVKLQTDTSCYIGGIASFIVSNKYILCIDNNRILQFSSDGKFIRCLAQHGRGPNEFLHILFCHINDSETFFYFTDTGSKGIKNINLDTGIFGKEINLATTSRALQTFINDSTLVVITGGLIKEKKDSIIVQDLNTNIIKGVPLNKNEKNNKSLLFDNLFKQGNNIYIYKPWIYGDTIYRTNGIKTTPYFLMKGVNQYSIDKNSEGFASRIMYFTNRFCIFENLPITISKYDNDENHFTPTVDPIGMKHYIAWFPKINLQELTSLSNEFTGKIHKDFDLMNIWQNIRISNNQLVFKMEAIDILEAIKNKSKLKIPEKYYNKYLEITKGLSENDNPVLLIGNIK